MPRWIDHLYISLAGRWYWARAAGVRTPVQLIGRYTFGQTPDAWQRLAIVAPARDVCCIAAAGSGKTTVLTARVAFLMDRCDVPPARIRAVTFMRKAADEMAERVQRICPGTGQPVISTIHSLCYRDILRLPGTVRIESLTRWWSSSAARELRAKAAGAPVLGAYQVAGGAAENVSVRDIMFELERDLESLESIRVNTEAARLIAHTERTGKDPMLDGVRRLSLSPQELLDRAAIRPDRVAEERTLKGFYVEALTAYRDFKRDRGTVDFNDLLERAAMRLVEDRALREELRRRYAHLLIDEYQDTNPIQIFILEYLLRGRETSLFVVGDDWQSICAFQDADPRWLVNFRRRHRGARRIVLGTNYRSRQPIIEASTSVVRRHLSLSRLGDKQVRAERRLVLPLVETLLVDEADEASHIVGAVARQLAGENGSLSEGIFVLARSNGWLSRLNRAFETSGLPYEIRDETRSRAPLGSGEEAGEEEGSLATKATVILTTVHRAKGLEADFVHVAGLTDWLLPSRFRDTLIDRARRRREEDHLAEELRVLYVAMTRAREHLTLWVPCWRGRPQPSRFLPARSRWVRTENLVPSISVGRGASGRNRRSNSRRWQRRRRTE